MPYYPRSDNKLLKVQISNLYYSDIQNTEVGIIFSFSLYIILLLVIVVIYFKRDTQDILVNKSTRK